MPIYGNVDCCHANCRSLVRSCSRIIKQDGRMVQPHRTGEGQFAVELKSYDPAGKEYIMFKTVCYGYCAFVASQWNKHLDNRAC